MLLLGDSIEVLKRLVPCSVDALVTDPPYGFGFMGKHWDYEVPSVEMWKAILRVMKPGAHALIFAGPRTYHRIAVNVEDAGFEIRDQLQWLFGQGFPKSLDISKAIDKAAGAEREVVGAGNKGPNIRGNRYAQVHGEEREQFNITTPSTDAAKQWEGWGTALKPANEPILLARKPISEKTVAKNVEKWGTGGLNIDACRIGYANQQDIEKRQREEASRKSTKNNAFMDGKGTSLNVCEELKPNPITAQGRFPSNLLLDEQAAEMLDEQSGNLKSGTLKGTEYLNGKIRQNAYGAHKGHESLAREGDSGGASRFFYCAKTSKSERNAGLEGMPEKAAPKLSGGSLQTFQTNGGVSTITNTERMSQNHHPTVKPIKLMSYLCKLITPPNGTVLDPFMGSGSTGVAAKQLGFKFIGIEREKEYFEIAQKRIEHEKAVKI